MPCSWANLVTVSTASLGNAIRWLYYWHQAVTSFFLDPKFVMNLCDPCDNWTWSVLGTWLPALTVSPLVLPQFLANLCVTAARLALRLLYSYCRPMS